MYVVGLMSGTSLDGIDAWLGEIHGHGHRLRVRQAHFLTHPFPDGLKTRLLDALDAGQGELAAMARLDVALGRAFGEAARAVCEAADLPLSRLDLVGSHGQTIWHGPSGADPVSWQLGEIAAIAELTGATTVGHFRSADVAAGGQGAPLVPYADWVLFGRAEAPIALQNLGGIGNVTYLPGGGSREIVAFDTGPGNMILDGLMAILTDGREAFDRDGAMALAGTADPDFLAALIAEDPFLAAPPPKSTGREAYGRARAERVLASARARGLSDADLMATAAAWTAASVADQYRFLPDRPETVYVSGGGARNPAVMRELAGRLSPARVTTVAELGIDPDAKEALAFALLAYQALAGEPAGLPEATGAHAPRVLGQIAPGRNFDRAVLTARAEVAATEQSNPSSVGLDTWSVDEAVAAMHAQDYDAVRAVGPAKEAIATLIEHVAAALAAGGRLFYLGAGTSGRLGVLDASECPPTFSTPPDWVQGLIAGGERALTRAVEGAEDDAEAGARDLSARGVGPLDVVVGLSANGGAPYVQGGLEAARRAGAKTAIVTCNPIRPELHQPDVAVVLPTGPEFLAGSTRLKAGTATKLVLNMITTLSMVQLGKVHDNMMVDLTVSNRKLLARAIGLVTRLTGLAPAEAGALLERAGGSVKRAAVMHHQGVHAAGADALLVCSRGRLRPWLQPSAE